MEQYRGHSRMTPSTLMSGQFWWSGEGRFGGVDGRKGVVVVLVEGGRKGVVVVLVGGGRKGVVVVLVGGRELWWCWWKEGGRE